MDGLVLGADLQRAQQGSWGGCEWQDGYGRGRDIGVRGYNLYVEVRME